MRNRKHFFIALFLLVTLTRIFSQTVENTPVGEWCQDKIWNSEFFLDISDSEIKYIEKKSEKFIRFTYHLDESSQIVIDGYYPNDPLNYQDMNRELYYNLSISKKSPIPFTRKGDKMSFSLVTQKGKRTELKLITREKRQETIDGWKSVGKTALGIGIGVAAGYVAYKAWDYITGEKDMQDIADDCLEASLRETSRSY